MAVQFRLMERSVVSIDEKFGVRYVNRFSALIDCNCLRTHWIEGVPQEDGPDLSHPCVLIPHYDAYRIQFPCSSSPAR